MRKKTHQTTCSHYPPLRCQVQPSQSSLAEPEQTQTEAARLSSMFVQYAWSWCQGTAVIVLAPWNIRKKMKAKESQERRPLRSTCRNRKKCHRQEAPGKQLEPEHGEEAKKRSEIANSNKSMKALQYREQIDVLRRPHDLTNILHLLGSLIFMATEIVAMISRINITREKL
jgi:hypothetical protein